MSKASLPLIHSDLGILDGTPVFVGSQLPAPTSWRANVVAQWPSSYQGRRGPPSVTNQQGARAFPQALADGYRDNNGNTWTGRGNKPWWLTTALGDGKTLERFAV